MICKKYLLLFSSLILCFSAVKAQTNESPLTIKQIMQDPKWIGVSPDNIFWSENSEILYFNWNPLNNEGDSLYSITVNNTEPQKVRPEVRRELPAQGGAYNQARTKKVYTSNGDLFLMNLENGNIRQITNTLGVESSPSFLIDKKKISYIMDSNLYTWNLESGLLTQVTNFRKGKEKEDPKKSAEGQWLYNQIELFEVLKERKEEKDSSKKQNTYNEPDRPKTIYTGEAVADNIQSSPDGRYITYNLYEEPSDIRETIVPNYVTESGFTENLSARPKVGSPQRTWEFHIYDIQKDTTYQLNTESIPGIEDHPEFLEDQEENGEPLARKVMIFGPYWTDDGRQNFIEVRSMDNKDRWIMTLDLSSGTPELLDRQHDEAWIAGPGIDWYFSAGDHGWMPDNQRVWFQSEESGYSHIYTVDTKTGKKEAVTKGNFEIYDPMISNDGKFWYYSSNEVHPGERHFYKMPVDGGKTIKLTSMEGNNVVTLSPDETMMAIRYSASNRPWELYLKENDVNTSPKQITHSLSEEFLAYDWRKPEHITFKASDGAKVHARLYKPENARQNAPAVVFVHGAGYLQNAHKWWSSYFREYMFHNFLVDNGYTVLDVDYRGSAGYGRDWRTGIYRHMGGKDLSDQVDGAKYLVDNHGIDPDKLGIYGGSYGGFITLMALFTEPDVFEAGAALRSVTDWAHYNHPYTANILNEPVTDSLAYTKSSPIYYAEGLEGALLICHGMIDTNVHFQDVVRLVQRLIELGKEDWELAVYPLESHGFVEPSSWTDEYRRIYELFERNLKSKENLEGSN